MFKRRSDGRHRRAERRAAGRRRSPSRPSRRRPRGRMPWQTTASLKNAKADTSGVGDVEPGCARVALDHLGARREASAAVTGATIRAAVKHRVVARLAPEREQRPEVGQRVAERAHLQSSTATMRPGRVACRMLLSSRKSPCTIAWMRSAERPDQLVAHASSAGSSSTRDASDLRPAPQLARHEAAGARIRPARPWPGRRCAARRALRRALRRSRVARCGASA